MRKSRLDTSNSDVSLFRSNKSDAIPTGMKVSIETVAPLIRATT